MNTIDNVGLSYFNNMAGITQVLLSSWDNKVVKDASYSILYGNLHNNTH